MAVWFTVDAVACDSWLPTRQSQSLTLPMRSEFSNPRRATHRCKAQSLLGETGINTPRKTEPPRGVLQQNEWWIRDLAKHLGMPRSSLDHWRKSGWINARKLPCLRGRWVAWADESEVKRLCCNSGCGYTSVEHHWDRDRNRKARVADRSPARSCMVTMANGSVVATIARLAAAVSK